MNKKQIGLFTSFKFVSSGVDKAGSDRTFDRSHSHKRLRKTILCKEHSKDVTSLIDDTSDEDLNYRVTDCHSLGIDDGSDSEREHKKQRTFVYINTESDCSSSPKKVDELLHISFTSTNKRQESISEECHPSSNILSSTSGVGKFRLNQIKGHLSCNSDRKSSGKTFKKQSSTVQHVSPKYVTEKDERPNVIESTSPVKLYFTKKSNNTHTEGDTLIADNSPYKCSVTNGKCIQSPKFNIDNMSPSKDSEEGSLLVGPTICTKVKAESSNSWASSGNLVNHHIESEMSPVKINSTVTKKSTLNCFSKKCENDFILKIETLSPCKNFNKIKLGLSNIKQTLNCGPTIVPLKKLSSNIEKVPLSKSFTRPILIANNISEACEEEINCKKLEPFLDKLNSDIQNEITSQQLNPFIIGDYFSPLKDSNINKFYDTNSSVLDIKNVSPNKDSNLEIEMDVSNSTYKLQYGSKHLEYFTEKPLISNFKKIFATKLFEQQISPSSRKLCTNHTCDERQTSHIVSENDSVVNNTICNPTNENEFGLGNEYSISTDISNETICMNDFVFSKENFSLHKNVNKSNEFIVSRTPEKFELPRKDNTSEKQLTYAHVRKLPHNTFKKSISPLGESAQHAKEKDKFELSFDTTVCVGKFNYNIKNEVSPVKEPIIVIEHMPSPIKSLNKVKECDRNICESNKDIPVLSNFDRDIFQNDQVHLPGLALKDEKVSSKLTYIHKSKRKLLKGGDLVRKALAAVNNLKINNKLSTYEFESGIRCPDNSMVSEPLIVIDLWSGPNILYICCSNLHEKPDTNNLNEDEEVLTKSIVLLVTSVPKQIKLKSIVKVHYPLKIFYCSNASSFLGICNYVEVLPSENSEEYYFSFVGKRRKSYLNFKGNKIPDIFNSVFGDPINYLVLNSNTHKSLSEAVLNHCLLSVVTLELKILHIFKNKGLSFIGVDSRGAYCILEFTHDQDLLGINIGNLIALKNIKLIKKLSHENLYLKSIIDYCGEEVNAPVVYYGKPENPWSCTTINTTPKKLNKETPLPYIAENLNKNIRYKTCCKFLRKGEHTYLRDVKSNLEIGVTLKDDLALKTGCEITISGLFCFKKELIIDKFCYID